MSCTSTTVAEVGVTVRRLTELRYPGAEKLTSYVPGGTKTWYAPNAPPLALTSPFGNVTFRISMDAVSGAPVRASVNLYRSVA